MLITKGTVLEELISRYPQTVDVFIKFGMPCFVCGEPAWGTLGENMERHKVKYPDKLLEVLNEEVSKADSRE